MPDTAAMHRVVIDARDDATTARGVNRHLEAAARAVNLYALAGAPPARVQVGVVVHGKTTPLVLSDASYRKHFDKQHPDADVIADIARCRRRDLHLWPGTQPSRLPQR